MCFGWCCLKIELFSISKYLSCWFGFWSFSQGTHFLDKAKILINRQNKKELEAKSLKKKLKFI